jgi:hypothetical protein
MSDLNVATSTPNDPCLVCTLCHVKEEGELDQCATCGDHICNDCALYGCSCLGRADVPLHPQIKADLRGAAIKLGALQAVARQGELSEWQLQSVKTLTEYIEQQTIQLHALEDKEYLK